MRKNVPLLSSILFAHGFTQSIDILHRYAQEVYDTRCGAHDERLAFGAMLDEAEGLNHRQRAFLANAMLEPHAVYKIQQYAKAYRVVYATARADLMGLAQRGFLVSSMEGKAFTFRLVPPKQWTSAMFKEPPQVIVPSAK